MRRVLKQHGRHEADYVFAKLRPPSAAGAMATEWRVVLAAGLGPFRARRERANDVGRDSAPPRPS